ncbi:putative ribonuclease H-like domain-containing protein [Tanacetum coccineum]
MAYDCRSPAATANNQRAPRAIQRVVTCFECGVQGHYKKDCPKLKSKNRGNQVGNGEARARAYVVGNAGTNSDSNVVTGMFLLNNRYASILFDTGADRSFVSTVFSFLIDIVPTTLDHDYDVELADEKIIGVNTILRGCTLNFLNHPFNIDLMLVELDSFDVIIGMNWLSKYHAVIVCDEKIVHIPFGNEILIDVCCLFWAHINPATEAEDNQMGKGDMKYVLSFDDELSQIFPRTRIEAIRLFLAYASFMGFMVYQMDVKSSFLYVTIEEEVYVCQPLGFEDPDYPDKVYKVVKALYGLHQAPRAWYGTLAKYLLDNRFQRGKIDQTLFIKKQKGDILHVHVYVDDIIFGFTNKELCTEFEKLMHDKFQMSSMGELNFFLGSEGFHQIIDFLTTSHIKYALTESPTIYVSLIEQFWQTTSASTLENGNMEITATIDGKVKVVTEPSIRRHLKLEDSDGISTLPTLEIFKQLALMGYVSNSASLTFQKGHFFPQWKFLIHTILHCLSPKKTAWEQFSSNIATAIICLATNRTFNFSNLIFDAMVKNLDRSTIPVESHHTPISATSTSQPPTSPPSIQTTHVAEEAANMPHDLPLLGGNTLGSDEGSMTLNELTVLCTQLSTKVASLEVDLKQTKKMSAQTQRRHEHDFEEPDFKFTAHEEDYIAEPDISTANILVSTAGPEVSTASPEVRTAAKSLVYIRRSAAKRKDKGKAIMKEAKPVQKKTKSQLEQERLGLEEALRLQEQLDEEERQRIAIVQEEASTFNTEEWDNIQAQIEVDEELALRLQAQEREGYS